MARSLIRLPQLQGESLPASSATAFKFGKEGGGANSDVMTIDTSANEVLFANNQTVKILGDLQVQGNQTIINTEVLTVEDSTIVAALPDVKTATMDTGGSASATIAVTCQNHGLAGGDKFYATGAGVDEGIYTVLAAPLPTASTFSFTHGSAVNLSSVDGNISSEILDTNSDFGGYLIPTEDGLAGLVFRDTQNDIQLRGKDVNVDLSLSVTGDSSLNGNVTLGDADADDITINGVIQGATAMLFDGATKNANRISLAISDPSAGRTITLPDADGVVSVAVADIGGGGQGAEDLGLQLSSAGQLSIDINDIGETLVSASGTAANDLDAADQIMISDTADGANGAHSIKKTTLSAIQSFLAAGGSQKESLKVAAQIPLGTANGKNGQNAAIFDYSSMSQGLRDALAATSDESQREVFLNGVLMREVDGSGDGDFVEDIANEELEFEFQLEADDFVVIVARA